ncbi:MAG: ATP-binding protein, partial [bacterium]
MYHLIYPQKTQTFFTNRVVELEILESYKRRLLQGEANKIAFIGTRRIGKSTILYEFTKRQASVRRLSVVYLNLQRLVMEPLSFARSYIGITAKWVSKDKADNFASYEDPEFCLLRLQKMSPAAAEYFYEFIKLTRNRDLPLKSIVEQALHFPAVLSRQMDIPIIFMIDEFQEITMLKNFKQLPEILGFMRDIMQTHLRILYVFAGSYIRLMQDIIEKPGSAFFGQINPYYLNRFSKQDSLSLLKKIITQFQIDLPPAAGEKMAELSSGHPFYIELLANAAHEAVRVDAIPLTPENIEKILLLQLLNEKSTMSFHLRYIYEDAIGRARGSTILNGILKVLALDSPLTITEIANKLSRKVGLVQSGLQQLMSVDLVNRDRKKYYVADSLLRLWIYFKFYHPEGAFSLKDTIVQELFEHFREKYLQTSVALGRAKEFELYYYVSKMQGKVVSGVRLPKFQKIIKNYVLPNGDEIDLFARNKESWVFELKWKNKLIGMKELQKLQAKIEVQRYV